MFDRKKLMTYRLLSKDSPIITNDTPNVDLYSVFSEAHTSILGDTPSHSLKFTQWLNWH